MADDTPDESGKGPKGPKGEKRREQILIGATVLGVILTVILVRKTSSSAQSNALPVSAPVGQTGTSAGSTDDFANLQNQVYGLAGGLEMLQTMVGQTSSPTPISSNPTGPVDPASNMQSVFVRGQDSALWEIDRTGSQWGQWKSLGGVITDQPQQIPGANGSLTVVARGQDNAEWQRTRDKSGAWSPWSSLNGIVAS